MSTIPIKVISQGKPILSAIDPPIEGPTSLEDRSHTKLVWLKKSLCIAVLYWQDDALVTTSNIRAATWYRLAVVIF